MGEAPGVRAVVVVVGEVVVEVTLKGGHLRHERAGERGPPALLEDGELEALDVAIGGGPASTNGAVFDAVVLDGLAEVGAAELRSIV